MALGHSSPGGRKPWLPGQAPLIPVAIVSPKHRDLSFLCTGCTVRRGRRDDVQDVQVSREARDGRSGDV